MDGAGFRRRTGHPRRLRELEEAVSGGEFSDIVNELPRDSDRLIAPPPT
jgi:hypothetical protein